MGEIENISRSIKLNRAEAGILKQKNAKLRLILSIPITEIGHGSNFKLDNRPLKSAKC